jgi:hypothetical protein
MIQEFKVLTSNFNAENSKGPIVINTIAKSGGKDFHGEAYFSARNYDLNANSWVNNYTGTARPENKFYYPGGNLGGPVLIPGTRFNKNRDKLFFFTGYEYYFQTLDTGLLSASVPTQGMRNGNFSAAELAKMGNVTASGNPATPLNGCITGASAASSCSQAVGLGLYGVAPNGILPASAISPIGQGLINVFPLPNTNPNSDGGYNYVKDVVFDQNSWQWLSRVDYNISDNTKLFVRYNLQREVQQFPVSLWWRNADSVPYPTPVLGKNDSQSVSASLTHVFSPTLSNEFVFGFTYIGFPNVFQDPAKVNRTDLNIPFTGLYHNGVTQIPAMTGWGGSEFGTVFNPGGFEAGGPTQGLYADKWLPSFGDNISKVWGTHTAKFGMYYEHVINKQPNSGYSNGLVIEADSWGGPTSNAYADLLTGWAAQYQEQNYNNIHNEGYNTVEFFGQDSWKITRRLTIDYGMRFSHLGAWYDKQHLGFAVWEPNLYDPSAPNTSYSGFTWHARNSSIPLSGFPNRDLFYAPRFGLAYDIFGDGKTVFRGGWGMFYYHNAQFTQGLDVPAGVQAPTLGGMTFAQIEMTNPGAVFSGSQGLNPTDNHEPLTYSYSATISRRLPFASLLEVSYVGNKNEDQLNPAGVGTNVNALAFGTLFNVGKDPGTLTGGAEYVYGPYPTYQAINVANHNLYSNYNSMQVSWVRQRGNYDISLNYTWSKAMGIVGQDQLNLKNDYGAEPFDRRNIINAAYSIQLPSPITGNAVAKGIVNGWQLTGVTSLQSGVNLTAATIGANSGTMFNAGGNISSSITTANSYGSTINAQSINGTGEIPLEPIITCNPTANLAPHQYVNGACFKIPTVPGTNGPIVGPEIFGPWFFNSDLGMFKNFQISETRKVQFRFEAYNFLNHPIWSFAQNGLGSSDLNLNFGANGTNTNTGFGYTPIKIGQRVVEIEVKFFF